MLPLQHVEEYLSISYVSAVAAHARVHCTLHSPDYGVDASIRWVKAFGSTEKCLTTGFGFDCQFKATINYILEDEFIVYDMQADAYNKLVAWEGTNPCLLVLMCLPREFDQWLSCNEEQLLLRHCCYWIQIKDDPTPNTSSKRIRIPRTNLFTPDTVNQLVEQVKTGELLC